jgi:hypothetical protein
LGIKVIKITYVESEIGIKQVGHRLDGRTNQKKPEEEKQHNKPRQPL